MAFVMHDHTTSSNPPQISSHSHTTKIAALPATPLRHTDGNGPWPNYAFPSKWEISDDFMCVHFIPRTVDKATWSSQCSFWNEAISLYAEQLLYKCPLKLNRLTFTASDIKRVYQRKNRLVPMCIIDIIKWMKYKPKTAILATYLEQNYVTHNNNNNNTNMDINEGNNTFLSISGMSTMMSSMFGYFMSNSNINSDDEAYESECEADDNCIKAHTKILYTPIVDELCERMSSLQFYRNVFDASSDLIQLLEIGIIDIKNNQDPHEMDVFIVNGLVFDRFCIQILKLTEYDVRILKKYLMCKSHIKLFYLDNDMEHITFSSEILEANNVKNEMLCFNLHSMDMLDKECLSKMQLLSINLTMKHLKLQKTENEYNLNNLNKELLDKLKKATTTQQKQVLMQKNIVLLKRKKALKHRISSLDGSIYNLETTLHSMEDVKINKMVFDEMKNADKLLKYIIHNGPSVEEVHVIKEDIKECMEMNEEMGQVLSKPMDTDYDDFAIDDDDLVKEYEDLEVMQHVNEVLPDAPNHDIVITDIHRNADNNVDDDNNNADKQVLIQ